MYDSWVYSVYNFALGLPIIFYGIFDQDIPADFALRHPEVSQSFAISQLDPILSSSTPPPLGLLHWSSQRTFEHKDYRDVVLQCLSLCHRLLFDLVQCGGSLL
jgi:hypothetical protein